MKSLKYTIVHPNGDVETVKIPTLFDPLEVAERLRYSVVFMETPKGHNVRTVNSGYVFGPVTVLIKDGRIYKVPKTPKTDVEATEIWKDLFIVEVSEEK